MAGINGRNVRFAILGLKIAGIVFYSATRGHSSGHPSALPTQAIEFEQTGMVFTDPFLDGIEMIGPDGPVAVFRDAQTGLLISVTPAATTVIQDKTILPTIEFADSRLQTELLGMRFP